MQVGPDVDLMRLYGNEAFYQEKTATQNIPLPMRLLNALRLHQRGHEEIARSRDARSQDEARNDAMRALIAMELMQANGRLRHTRPPVILGAAGPDGSPASMLAGAGVPLGLDEGMVRMASQVVGAGIDLAHFEKDAGFADLLGRAGSAVAGAAGKASATVSKLPKNFGATNRFLQAGAQLGVNAAPKPGVLGRAMQAVSPTARLQAADAGVAMGGGGAAGSLFAGGSSAAAPAAPGRLRQMFSPTARLQAADAAAHPLAPPSLRQPFNAKAAITPDSGFVPPTVPPATAAPKPTGGAYRTPGAQSPAPVAAAAASPPRAPAQPPAPAPTPAAPSPALPAAPSATPAATPPSAPPEQPGTLQRIRNDLGEGKWKWKVPMLAAGAVGAYGAYRGLQAGLGYLSGEAHPNRFNQGAPQMAYGVNEYGYPQMGTPL